MGEFGWVAMGYVATCLSLLAAHALWWGWLAQYRVPKWRGSRDMAKARLVEVLADDRLVAQGGVWLCADPGVVLQFRFLTKPASPLTVRRPRLRWRYAA